MGRFATTVPLYENLRSPYAAGFFETVARRARLRKADSLIDLGTGPGIIALGFASYVSRIVGVDPEPAMLEAARQTLAADVGTYNVVTIGRALHWLEPEATAALLGRLVTPGGVILVCASASAADGRNGWLAAYNEARRSWSHSAEGERHHQDLDTLLRGTRFHVGETITVESRHQISVSDLARRVLTFSSSSPAVIGTEVEEMLRDVKARLLPLSQAGILTEIMLSTATVARQSR
jgi:SAM-dependent methyltransferase